MTPGPALRKTKLPKGFTTTSINCGVRRYRPDLGAVLSDCNATVAAVYTQNTCQAAPIQYCKSVLPSDEVRAIITNSGQANAATGKVGLEDNKKMVEKFAEAINVNPEQVASASTGVIGIPLNMEKILSGIPELVKRNSDYAEAFATAIMTTDLVPKTITTDLELSTGTITITGICKGSGMIHPNMATMLGYFLTDIRLTKKEAQDYLGEVVNNSFNMISVDGETSTNDTCFIMANGASKVALETENDKEVFKKALQEVAIFMAKSIAQDGEGASKLVEVQVKGLADLTLARKAAKGIVLSPLVKTAIHGEDPNWGRIYSRLGQDGVPGELVNNMTLAIQGVTILAKGDPVHFEYYDIRSALKEDFVHIEIDFAEGTQVATAWGCDLTKKYIDINTEYN
jgi:glutamate N-acetyltransferase/amino-acid N-acetyltransferase